MGSDSHSQDIIEASNVYFECNIKVSTTNSMSIILYLTNNNESYTNNIKYSFRVYRHMAQIQMCLNQIKQEANRNEANRFDWS